MGVNQQDQLPASGFVVHFSLYPEERLHGHAAQVRQILTLHTRRSLLVNPLIQLFSTNKNSKGPSSDGPDIAQFNWSRTLAEMEAKWSQLGLHRLWWLRRADLSRQLKRIQETTPTTDLFNNHEQAARRREITHYLDANFCFALEKGLPRSFWNRVRNYFNFGTKNRGNTTDDSNIPDNTIETWQRRYAAANRLHDFQNMYDLYLRKRANIAHRGANTLFDAEERAVRLLPEIKSTRRIFRKFQERHLRLHTRYAAVIRSLPDDELDEQLRKLAENFSLIGRTREWFRELEKLIHDVFDQVKNKDYGQNEPVIRLLQNDFLLTMQGRFSVYWRYYELRELCFANNMTELINNISYFEKQRAEMQASGVSFHECDNLLKQFTRSLNTALTSKARRERSEVSQRERLLEVDHSARLEEWAEFKETNPKSHTSVISIFNHLRPILVHCPEWRQELSVFRSLVKVKRLSDAKRKNSDAEMKDARLFVQRMTDRIDSEITTDVSFRILEQELVRGDEYLPDLYLARRKIALQREMRNKDSSARINEIKQAFIRVIWNKRAPEDQETRAVVTPLFARARPGFSGKPSEKDLQSDGPAKFNR